jgi:hypothetical protein
MMQNIGLYGGITKADRTGYEEEVDEQQSVISCHCDV